MCWEPDRKFYLFLLALWSFFLAISLATVSPEEMFLMSSNDLKNSWEALKTLEENSVMLKTEVNNWKQNSEQLEIELENSSLEISNLINELDRQKPLLTELGSMLAESQNLVGGLKVQLKESMTQASVFEQYSKQLLKDLSRYKTERNIWRGAAMVTGVLAIIGWTMILWYP